MTAVAMRAARRAVERATGTIRLGDWWDFKLSPVLGMFWGTALGSNAPLLPLAPAALLLLAAIGACAAFVSVINDLTDLDADMVAGKANGMSGRPRAAKAAFAAVPALIGVAVAAAWRDHLPLAAAYLASFVAFILYSVPPVRLKGRGMLGVVADAAGAHLFPTLTAVLLAFAAIGAPADPVLFGATAAWGFAFGVRGILWHQLGDIEADARAAVRTLAGSVEPAAIVRFAERVVFPIELGALLLLLWSMHGAVACLFLLLHAAVLWSRYRRDRIAPAIVQPRPGAAIALHEYYGMWLPAAIIVQSALRHPADLSLLVVLVGLFPGRALQVVGEIWRMRPGEPAADRPDA
jgi:hypothetical protein